MTEPPTPTSFEEAVTRLEEIVSALETGNLPLDECLRQFEVAVSLSRYCAARLETAEKQIRVLTGDGELEPADELPWASEVPPSRSTKKPPTAEVAVLQSNFDWDE
jgi:exodeoxyribonuclease VII small subunit